MKRWHSSALAALGGVFQTLSLAPFDWVVLLPIGLALWFYALRHHPILASFCFGLGLYASGAHWVWVSIYEISQTPWPIAALLLSGFVLGLACVFAVNGWLFRQFGRLSPWLGFPALIVLSEAVRTYFLTGFPWLFAGYAWLDTPWASLAPYVGVYGLSALSGLLAVALIRKAIVPLLVLAALAWVPTPSLKPLGEPIAFTLVQGNIPADKKWSADWRDEIIDRHLTLSIHNPNPLLVWSEAALPLLDHEADAFFARFAEAFPASALVTGRLIAAAPDRLPRYYNAIAGYGQAEGANYKQRLVPFGEYMPLESWLRGTLDFFDLPLSTLVQGVSPAPLQVLGYQPGTLICYEIAYPGLAWRQSQDRPFLISVSNDAWFGDSIARDQHLQMARMRSLELGRPMLRATNDGITAHIDYQGDLAAQLDNYAPGALVGTLQPAQHRTAYSLLGPWPIIGLAVALLLLGRFAVPFPGRDR